MARKWFNKIFNGPYGQWAWFIGLYLSALVIFAAVQYGSRWLTHLAL